MKKARIIIIAISICLLFVLSGCSSTFMTVPKEELKRKAMEKMQSEYSNVISTELTDEQCNHDDQTYDMYYTCSTSMPGYFDDYIKVKARTIYESSTHTWSDIYLTQLDIESVPNVSGLGKLHARSSYGGDVSMQLLSVDRDSQTITVDIDANHLTVKAEHCISYPEYTIDIHKKSIRCAYEIIEKNSAWEKHYNVYLGKHDEQDIFLIVSYNRESNKPSFTLYVGYKDDLIASGSINFN